MLFLKLLRCAFKQAVRWEIVSRNPFDNVILPKTEYGKRDIWTAEMIRTALDKCTDSRLYVAMNLAFACSPRMGEILGLVEQLQKSPELAATLAAMIGAAGGGTCI